jgi:DNA-binding NarL/FixJ family response regulator
VTVDVLVADDQELVRAGLRTMLEADPGLRVVGEAVDGPDAVGKALRLRPDVVLMDIRMPGWDGIEATRRIVRAADPPPAVLVVTTFELDEYVVAALRAGADGFLLKTATSAELHAAVRAVAGGGAVVAPGPTRRLLDTHVRRASPLPLPPAYARLSQRERDVLLHVASGRTNREIGAVLFLGETTVKTHVSSLLATLALGNRVQLAVFAYEHGLVVPGGRDGPDQSRSPGTTLG